MTLKNNCLTCWVLLTRQQKWLLRLAASGTLSATLLFPATSKGQTPNSSAKEVKNYSAATTTEAKTPPPFTYYFDKEKTKSIKFSGYMQFWMRTTQMNPGSKNNSTEANVVNDLSLRRLRMKMMIVPAQKTLVVLQVGPTNLNNLANADAGMDLLDAYVEYQPKPWFQFGGGKSNWRGLSRFAAVPASTTLMYEVPLMALSGVNRTDLTTRNLGVYVKGQFHRWDYRIALTKPYINAVDKLNAEAAVLNDNLVRTNYGTYIKYQFKDKEVNLTPNQTGTYLGKRAVFNIGFGAEFQKDATWQLQEKDTVTHNISQLCLDVFADLPINKERGTGFTLYAAAFRHRFGPGYTRVLALNNPGNGTVSGRAVFNGSGNGYPVIGTGSTLTGQLGYWMPYLNSAKKCMQLLPAAGFQYSKFERLSSPMLTWDAGLSLLLKGHASKFSFNAQQRPVFTENAKQLTCTSHKMMYVLMYQFILE